MSFLFTPIQEHKGFNLKTEFSYDHDIMIITGRNGSGKTRFLESIRNRTIKVLDGVNELQYKDIRILVNSNSEDGIGNGRGLYTPNYQGSYDFLQIEQRKRLVSKAFKQYSEYKEFLDFTDDEIVANGRPVIPENRELSFDIFRKACIAISGKLNKKPSELSCEEVIFHWQEPNRHVLGTQNITQICNLYLERVVKNEFNEFLREVKGKNVPFYTDEGFKKVFGEKPWVLLNQIITSISDGKFVFNEPQDGIDYIANIQDSRTGEVIPATGLSSGEMTLLWLALTLFNVQYFDSDSIDPIKLLLLDEPDAYLHPKMVDKILKVLKTFAGFYSTKIILTTHSPTTVALAPNKSVFLLNDNYLSPVEKDVAIAELLDGISKISIIPENRRQVYVESYYDADFYTNILNSIYRLSSDLDTDISLSFVSSGSQLPEQQIVDCLKSVLQITDKNKVEEFTKALNGVGSCSQVYGAVEALRKEGNLTVRGIVDWDNNNKPKDGVIVLGEGYAYTLENLALDPVNIAIWLNYHDPSRYTNEEITSTSLSWHDWINNKNCLQKATDWYINKILGRPNCQNVELTYMSGISVLTDTEYLFTSGHSYEGLLVELFPEFKSLIKQKKKGYLKVALAQKGMVGLTNGKLIPKLFEQLFRSLR